MNQAVENLHVAARRYCLDQYKHWAEQYDRLIKVGRDRQGEGYSPEAWRIFVRYRILEAIRTDLERLTGSDVGTLVEARELFALAGLTAESPLLTCNQPEAHAVESEERKAFARFVRELPEFSLGEVEPLSYVRVLQSDEAERIWDLVELKWGLKRRQYGYPLADAGRLDIQAFQETDFLAAISPTRLGSLFAERGVTRLWELREYGPEFEIDSSTFTPEYNGAEGVWTSPSLDWIIYTSHESSIAVAGWLLPEVKRIWPAWERHTWSL